MRIYVADTYGEGKHGRVHVLDTEDGKKVGTLTVDYCPSVAASRRRKRFFVVHSRVERGGGMTHHVSVFDARTLERTADHVVAERFLYNVAPSFTEMAVDPGGTVCYLSQGETVAEDVADYSLVVVDPRKGVRTKGGLRFSEGLAGFGLLAGGDRDIWFDLSGRQSEHVGVARVGASRSPLARTSKTLDHGKDAEKQRLIEFASVAAVGLDDGSGSFHVARDGTARFLDASTKRLSEAIHLDIPPAMVVPIQAIASAGDRLYVGVSPPESAARGVTDLVMEFRVGRAVFRERAFGLGPAIEKFGLSPGGSEMIALSREEPRVDVIDLKTLERVRRFRHVGKSPVQFSVSA